jgi:hypothetical protein
VSGNGFAGTVFRFAVPGGGDAAEEPGPATCC